MRLCRLIRRGREAEGNWPLRMCKNGILVSKKTRGGRIAVDEDEERQQQQQEEEQQEQASAPLNLSRQQRSPKRKARCSRGL